MNNFCFVLHVLHSSLMYGLIENSWTLTSASAFSLLTICCFGKACKENLASCQLKGGVF